MSDINDERGDHETIPDSNADHCDCHFFGGKTDAAGVDGSQESIDAHYCSVAFGSFKFGSAPNTGYPNLAVYSSDIRALYIGNQRIYFIYGSSYRSQLLYFEFLGGGAGLAVDINNFITDTLANQGHGERIGCDGCRRSIVGSKLPTYRWGSHR
jgi:hypothetical protein